MCLRRDYSDCLDNDALDGGPPPNGWQLEDSSIAKTLFASCFGGFWRPGQRCSDSTSPVVTRDDLFVLILVMAGVVAQALWWMIRRRSIQETEGLAMSQQVFVADNCLLVNARSADGSCVTA
jgi:hypothetical protein